MRGFLVAVSVLGWVGSTPARAVDVDGAVRTLQSLRAGHAARPEALPVAFEERLTAWQTAPRRLVLSGDRIPGEADPYVMTHPLFAFRWADGGRLVVDAGLDPAEARSFVRPMEFLGAGEPTCGVDPFGGIEPESVRAAVFSHLHVDHVQGLQVLCAGGTRIPARLPAEQRDSDERFERQGRDALEAMQDAGCIELDLLALDDAEAVAPALVGFPGVHRVAVPGHTPGSQLIVGFLADRDGGAPRGVVVSGDVVNHRAGFRNDRPKPWIYRRLIVREVDELQSQNRHLLARLEQEGFEIRVDHHLGIPEGTEGVPCP